MLLVFGHDRDGYYWRALSARVDVMAVLLVMFLHQEIIRSRTGLRSCDGADKAEIIGRVIRCLLVMPTLGLCNKTVFRLQRRRN